MLLFNLTIVEICTEQCVMKDHDDRKLLLTVVLFPLAEYVTVSSSERGFASCDLITPLPSGLQQEAATGKEVLLFVTCNLL